MDAALRSVASFDGGPALVELPTVWVRLGDMIWRPFTAGGRRSWKNDRASDVRMEVLMLPWVLFAASIGDRMSVSACLAQHKLEVPRACWLDEAFTTSVRKWPGHVRGYDGQSFLVMVATGVSA
jgi:hypothetical protein